MRKTILTFSFAILSALSFAQSGEYQKYVKIGQFHNEALNNYYVSLTKQENVMDVNGISEKVYESALRNPNFSEYAEVVKDGYYKYSTTYLNNRLENTKKSITDLERAINNDLSTTQKEYYSQIYDLTKYENARDYSSQMLKLMTTLENDNRLKIEDKADLFLAAGIGTQSFNY